MSLQQPPIGLKAKRAVDLLGASIGCIALAAPGAVIAILIQVESRGPAIYMQKRVGKDGKPFKLLKFRSMLRPEDSLDGSGNPLPNYDRVTKIGRVLRKSSLDETPQLVNVLKGEMSLVGPRPTLQYQVDRYNSDQRRRLTMRPGLTGLAQVSGRNSLTWDQKIALDLEYVDNWSLVEDFRILLRTIKVLVSRESTEFVQHDTLSAHTDSYLEDI